ncbi:hypothetical protein, conserved [Plasmodium gonderi]|uniref:Uncharacterized protein n=1 Tax=Plasmodium gonderi TaxID=77519 RepID=A0A1Y1JDQ2_PLAGO|nr:hypothetical protein, conserved [Plasmodium gonderi]GAW79337.1 hypothetical protein, conserved [Plasmodium gonderi]
MLRKLVSIAEGTLRRLAVVMTIPFLLVTNGPKDNWCGSFSFVAPTCLESERCCSNVVVMNTGSRRTICKKWNFRKFSNRQFIYYWRKEEHGVRPWRVFVSKPAQKKVNQEKGKIIVNKKKREEKLKNKISKNVEFKNSSKYKIIEDLIEGYPYTTLPVPMHLIEKEPFIILKEKIKAKYLKGYELPFGLIDPVKYELLKLIGKLCDPFKNLCCHSLTPRLFIDKLFKNRPEISYDDFCYRIEYKLRFLMPSYTEMFKYEKELLWKQWIAVRNLKEVSPETPPDDNERVQKILKEDETTILIAMIRVNREINNQGIHPSILKMFFDFLNVEKCPLVLKRDNAFLKLETIMHRLKNREFLEGIKPDYIYFMLNQKAQQYFNNFDKEEFEKTYHDSLNYNAMKQNIINQNKLYKQERRLFSQKTKNSLMKFYDIQLPTFFKEYIKKKEHNYKLIQDKIKRMIDNKYLKRKTRREDILAGRIVPQPITLDAEGDNKTQLRKKKKKKKK